MSINKNFSIRSTDIDSFKSNGFLLLKGLFTQELISYFSGIINDELQEPTDKYQTGFNRVRYDIFDKDSNIYEVLSDSTFKKVLSALCERDMIFTQALAFELKKSSSSGFPWHIGTQSFGFQRAEDFGCTIWIPLVPIDAKGQRGGMAYVPTNKVSGDFMYKCVDPSTFNLIQEKIDRNEDLYIEEFMQLRDGPLNDPAMKKMLDYYTVEDSFELGDALIFDKNVIHRSVKLSDGKLDSRPALAIRFTDAEARYDKKRAMDLEVPRKFWNYAGPTSIHLTVASEDGTLMKDSPLFKENLNQRLIKKQ
ncbi:MAG: hypothetical protein C7N14_05825 [Bacteroidetes bacterium]|nr:MAG: hypothetical protein C7N14_05825 [Bacteroidota bacterium]